MKNVLARIIQITQLSRMSSHYVKTSQSVFSFKACIRLKLQRVLYWMERIQVLLMRLYCYKFKILTKNRLWVPYLYL